MSLSTVSPSGQKVQPWLVVAGVGTRDILSVSEMVAKEDGVPDALVD